MLARIHLQHKMEYLHEPQISEKHEIQINSASHVFTGLWMMKIFHLLQSCKYEKELECQAGYRPGGSLGSKLDRCTNDLGSGPTFETFPLCLLNA